MQKRDLRSVREFVYWNILVVFDDFMVLCPTALAILMGWGFLKDFNRDEFVPKVLQQVELPMITTETCQVRHGYVDHKNGNYSTSVTDSMLCTGFLEGGKGGCYFDSGLCN